MSGSASTSATTLTYGVFQKLFNQGMILAFAYEDAAGSKVPTDEVEEKNGTAA